MGKVIQGALIFSAMLKHMQLTTGSTSMAFDRRAHWQGIYREKSPQDVSWYQQQPKVSMELIQRCGVNKDDAVIDVGGGASVLVDHLCKEGYTNLTVLDISSTALESARNRMGQIAEEIEWLESDITEFSPPRQYSLWHDRAVFHFLTEKDDRRRYVDSLNQALKPGGHLIIAAFAIGGPDKCSGLDIVQYDAPKLMAELGNEFELLETVDELHKTPANKEQHFGYFLLQKNH